MISKYKKIKFITYFESFFKPNLKLKFAFLTWRSFFIHVLLRFLKARLIFCVKIQSMCTREEWKWVDQKVFCSIFECKIKKDSPVGQTKKKQVVYLNCVISLVGIGYTTFILKNMRFQIFCFAFSDAKPQLFLDQLKLFIIINIFWT